MGYRCSFMDNESYTAQDINQRFSALFTEGVVLGNSGNILADLNELGESLVTEGVSGDCCRLIKVSGGYKISEGSALMEDGSCIIFDSDGYNFQAGSGMYHYVYLKRNEPDNTIEIVVDNEVPEGKFVLLGEITKDGKVLDRRKYAKLKVNSSQSGTLKIFEAHFYASEDHKDIELEFLNGNFEHIILRKGRLETSSGRDLRPSGDWVYDLVDGEEIKVIISDYGGHTRGYWYLTKDGTKLKLRLSTSEYSADFTLPFWVI